MSLGCLTVSRNLTLSVRDSEEFIRQIEASAHYLGQKEVGKLTGKALKLINERELVAVYGGAPKVELRQDVPNANNGYRRLDL